MASEAVTDNDKKLLEIIGGEKLLITIIFVGTVLIFFILWANRHISRMFLISKKGPHTGVGNDAPKDLRKEIEKYLNLIKRVKTEPKLLCDQGNKDAAMSSYVERRDDSTYVYRRKVFDLMSCLNDLLCRVDVCLAPKQGRSIRDHFQDLQKPPYAPFLDCKELCDRVVGRYEHARYGSKSFDLTEFEAFAEDMENLTQKVYHNLPVPGSLLMPSSRVAKNKSSSSVLDKQSQGLISINEGKHTEVISRSKKTGAGSVPV